MYSLEDISQLLNSESEKLSVVLGKVAAYAKAQGMNKLAAWCMDELVGYQHASSKKRQSVKEYRKVVATPNDSKKNDVAWQTREICTLGLPDIEWYADHGVLLIEASLQYDNEFRHPRIYKGYLVSSQEFHRLLQRIRSEARVRLVVATPRPLLLGSTYPTPDFGAFVQDIDLARALKGRWTEANHCFAAGAYLATVILLGSILEGVLLSKAQNDPKSANLASTAPKKAGNVLPFAEWKLMHLIDVAYECGWIKKPLKDFSHVVRDYRNLVHPNKEQMEGATIDVSTCKVIWEVVSAALA